MKSNVRNLQALNTKINKLNQRKNKLNQRRNKQRATLKKTETELSKVKAQYGEIAQLKLEIISRNFEPSVPLIDMTSDELDKWLKSINLKLKSADENSKLLHEREKQTMVLMKEIKELKSAKSVRNAAKTTNKK